MDLSLKSTNNLLLNPEYVRKRSFTFSSVLFFFSVVIYSSSFTHDFFIWDDNEVALSEAIRVFSVKGIMSLFTSFHSGLYHPVTSLSFMIDYAVGKGSPAPYHVTNVLLHAFNSVFLYLFLKKLIKNDAAPFFAALLFCIHPVHVEAVAWITSRKDLLSAFFFLLTLLSYLRYREKRTLISYLPVLVFTILSMLSKIQTVTIPFILILIDLLNNRQKAGLFNNKIPLLLMALVLGLLNISAQNEYGYISYGYHYSVLEKILLIFYSAGFYFLKNIFPYPVSVFYPFPFHTGDSFPLNTLIIPGVALLIAVLLFIFSKKLGKINLFLFGIAFFTFTLLPGLFVSFHRDAIAADRYNYLPSAGLILMVMMFFDISRKNKLNVLVSDILMLVITMAFGIISLNQVKLWNDETALFTSALNHYSESEIILNTLATKEIRNEDYRNAIQHLDKAITVCPDYCDALVNRGTVYSKIGEQEKAIKDFTSALKNRPAFPQAYFNRGNAYMKRNEYLHAYTDFTHSIKFDPRNYGAFQNRAIVRGNMGDYTGAICDLDTALMISSSHGSTWYLHGIASFRIGKNGCNDLRKALEMGFKEAAPALEYFCRN